MIYHAVTCTDTDCDPGCPHVARAWVDARAVAEYLHAEGMRVGYCSRRDGTTDHHVEAHLADARFVVGYPPVTNPHHLMEFGRDEESSDLLAMRRRFGDDGWRP